LSSITREPVRRASSYREGGEMWPVLRLVERGGGDRGLENVDVTTAEHEGAVEDRSPHPLL
jgi:hypothetical protein